MKLLLLALLSTGIFANCLGLRSELVQEDSIITAILQELQSNQSLAMDRGDYALYGKLTNQIDEVENKIKELEIALCR